MNEEQVKKLLIKEYKKGNILDSGYDSDRGRYYVEVMDCHFIVERGYIFEDSKPYVDMTWYVQNYYPIIQPQLPNMINELNNRSRRAVLTYNYPDYPTTCTNYTNCLVRDNIIHMFVHMRSNEVNQYISDVKWHKLVINHMILPKLNYSVDDIVIHWNADSFHLYIDNKKEG